MHLQRTLRASPTLSKQAGWPLGHQVMPYGLDDQGQPNVFPTTMAMHTQNLGRSPTKELLVTPPEEANAIRRRNQSHPHGIGLL